MNDCCPVCEKEMEVQGVMVRPARQEGGEIVDAQWDDMYVCEACQIYEPIIDETDDGDGDL